jgi:hypothetical protein
MIETKHLIKYYLKWRYSPEFNRTLQRAMSPEVEKAEKESFPDARDTTSLFCWLQRLEQ